MSKAEGSVYFREVQSFRNNTLFNVGLLIGGLTVLVFFLPAVLGWWPMTTRGTGQPMPLWTALLTATLMMLALLLPWLFLRLITEVRRDGVIVKLFPFWGRLIPYQQIQAVQAVQYRPIREYGGWGIRYRLNGRAYNCSGNLGVRLEMPNKKHILIGSLQHERLTQAIQEQMERSRKSS